MSEFEFNDNKKEEHKVYRFVTKTYNFLEKHPLVIVSGVAVSIGFTLGIIVGTNNVDSYHSKTSEKECAAIVIQDGDIKVYDLGVHNVKKHMEKDYVKYYFEENKTAVYIIYGDEAYNRAELISYNIELDKNNYLINDGLFSDEYYYEYKKLDENGVKISSISRKVE